MHSDISMYRQSLQVFSQLESRNPATDHHVRLMYDITQRQNPVLTYSELHLHFGAESRPLANTTNSLLTANCDFDLSVNVLSSGASFAAYSGSANDSTSDFMSGKMNVVTASQSMKVAFSPKAARAAAFSASVLKCYRQSAGFCLDKSPASFFMMKSLGLAPSNWGKEVKGR